MRLTHLYIPLCLSIHLSVRSAIMLSKYGKNRMNRASISSASDFQRPGLWCWIIEEKSFMRSIVDWFCSRAILLLRNISINELGSSVNRWKTSSMLPPWTDSGVDCQGAVLSYIPTMSFFSHSTYQISWHYLSSLISRLFKIQNTKHRCVLERTHQDLWFERLRSSVAQILQKLWR